MTTPRRARSPVSSRYPRQIVRTSARTGSLRARLCQKVRCPHFLAQPSSRAGPCPPAKGPKLVGGRSTGEVLRPTGEAARGEDEIALLGIRRLEPSSNPRNYNDVTSFRRISFSKRH